MDIKQPSGNSAPTSGHTSTSKTKSRNKTLHKFMKISAITLLFSGTILVVAMLLIIVFGNKNASNEAEYVDTSKHQAVFMNGGQVYFGKITELNKSYITLQDIYYLQVNQQVQPKQGEQQQNDVTLVKLGCELHGPQDLMVIKQDQVIFWENLKEDGKVAEAVKQFQSQNPNGLQCEDASASTDANPEQ